MFVCGSDRLRVSNLALSARARGPDRCALGYREGDNLNKELSVSTTTSYSCIAMLVCFGCCVCLAIGCILWSIICKHLRYSLGCSYNSLGILKSIANLIRIS